MALRCAVALLIGLAACGSPGRRPPVEAPVEATTGEVIAIGADAGEVRARVWRPAGALRAAALVIADRDERSARAMVRLAAHLVADGAVVVVVERPEYSSFAPSDGERRAARVADWLRRAVGTAPLFVIGDRRGATVALRFAQADRSPLAGVVALEPWLAFDGGLPRLVVRTLADDIFWLRPGVGPLGALWDDAAALDEPLLLAPGDGPDAAAIALDLAARSASLDRTVADADEAAVVAWVRARTAAAPPAPPAPPPPPPALPAPGLAVSLTYGVGVARFEDGSYTDGAIGYSRALLAQGRIGWAGAVSYQGIGGGFALMPVGLGARLGRGGQLGLVAGIGLDGPLTGTVPVEASAELPLGRYLRGLATATVEWDLDDHHPDDLAASIDDVQLRLGLRIGGDRHLWQRTTAGGGFYLVGTYRRLGDEDIVGIELGYHLSASR